MAIHRRLHRFSTACGSSVAALFGLAVLALAWTPAASQAADENPNSVVAAVNADPITRQMLADATLQRYGAGVLDNVIINRQLILQACHERGIQITETEISQEISRLATKFGLDVQAYLKLLQDERDITPGRYAREIIWPMLSLRKLVADQVEPTAEEFEKAFKSEYGEAVKCRMIVVTEEGKARRLHAEAMANPKAFGQLAEANSDDAASASVGGLIPPIRRYTGDSRLEEAAFALQNGQVSPVLKMGDQWVFLQAVRRILAATPNATAMPAIREQINDRIRDQKMKGAATELFTKLQVDSKIQKVFGDEELTKRYPGVAAIVNGRKVTIAQLSAECVKRHGAEVLESEINYKLLSQALRGANKTVTDEDIQVEIARAAIAYGFTKNDGTADLDAWLQSVKSDGQTTYQIYIREAVWPSVALKKLVEDRVQVSEEDLKRGYEKHFGERVEVLACVLADQRTAQKVWKMARDNPSEEFFGRLAADYSVEPVSASNHGKVPPIRKYSGQPTIEREAFKMETGHLSGVIAVADKYIILRCQGRTKPLVQDPAVVRGGLTRELMDKKFDIEMAKELDRLKETAEIENFFDAAKEIAKAGQSGTSSR
ncbi:MAG: peptidylprolyl isomerase [Planctomycetota bacterium]